MPTAHKILHLLNRESLSVTELATRLGISRNSAHVQVSKLEAAGAIEKIQPAQATDSGKRAGKPAFSYRLAPRHEDRFSSAFKPVLGSLIETIGARFSGEDREALLKDAGRRLAESSGLGPSGDLDTDIERALAAVNGLGAMAERHEGSGEAPTITCYTCPVATLVHKDPMVCDLVGSFFAEATGAPVAVRCRRGETVVCGFSFDPSAEE